MSSADPQSEAFAEDELGKAYDTRILMRLWPYVRPYWRQVAATLVLFVPLFALELAPAWIVKSGIDHVVEAYGLAPLDGSRASAGTSVVSSFGDTVDRAVGGLLEAPDGWSVAGWLALVYVLTTLTLGGLQYVYQVLMASTGQYAMAALRQHVFEHIQKLQMSYFDVIPVGRLVTRATNDVENVAEMFAQGLVALITDLSLIHI